jgi:hypothetical protein
MVARMRPSSSEKRSAVQAEARCVCGAARLEVDVPGLWAWHDHSEASRRAQGCAYATYVGSWKSRFRILQGEEHLTRYEDPERRTVRSFCARCGTPMLYERARSPKVVNIPRALFLTRTGREPRYHMNLAEQADWAWTGEPLKPLKGYPGVMWTGPARRKRRADGVDRLFSPEEG